MKHTVALLPAALLMIHCGGEPSVASKSAAAYREAQAKGTEIGGGHEHGGRQMAGTSGSAADAHEGHTMNARAGSPAPQQDAHAGHTMPRTGSAPDPHAGHSGARAISPAPQQDAHAGHGMPSAGSARRATPDPHAAHSGARAIPPASSPPAAPVIRTPPTSNAEMRDLRPAATLQPDAFDAPAAASVSEAAKATGGTSTGHEGHKP